MWGRAVVRSAKWIAVGLLISSYSPGWAHYHMLLPQTPSTTRDTPVTLVFQWGHPFEHQLFDAAKPASLKVLRPDGMSIDLNDALQKVALETSDKKATAFRLQFTPEQRGDFTFVAATPPIWMEEEQMFFQDRVKVVLHVQSQKGWDVSTGHGFELIPLTRPYGLIPGLVFQCQALADGTALPGALFEVERYNSAPPKVLPPDEHITRQMKADPNGIATCTLPEAGWWCITAVRDDGTRERAGKSYPVKQRATLWVHVDAKP